MSTVYGDNRSKFVMPALRLHSGQAPAGIQVELRKNWIPAFAGMTVAAILRSVSSRHVLNPSPYNRGLFNFLFALLWCALLPGNATGASVPPLALLYPADRSVFVGAGFSHLVLEIAPAVKVSVRLNGRPVEPSKLTDKVHHYLLRLEFGSNSVEVEALDGDRVVAREKRELFFFSPIAGAKQIVPDGFAANPFHRAGRPSEKCAGCHVLEPQKGDLSPASPAASSCYGCHQDLTRVKNVHGPASLWMCLACHNPASVPAKYATPSPVRDLCYGCHVDQKNYFFSSPYQHGPTATGMCTICHDPHGSDNEFWLKKEPWNLCTTCHADKASGRHVIAWGPSGNTHPTRGRPDPMKPEREFSCRSCHNPHASKSPKLWNFDATETYQLCWTCHQK
jgi:predicted CXXCH cytochrome family protein